MVNQSHQPYIAVDQYIIVSPQHSCSLTFNNRIINIINMIEFDLEVQINQLLTLFLQNFKNIFAAKMSLIESICANNNSLQSNPQFLLLRLSTKTFKFEWSLDPYSLIIVQEMISNIHRFYLRIQEYLQFRLSTLVNLQDKAFNKEIENYHKSLQKIIFSLENHPTLVVSIGDFLSQLSKAEILFTSKLLELISTKNHSLTRGPLDYESLHETKVFIQSKICKQQLSMFKEKKIILNIPLPSREKKFSFKAKQQESKLRFVMRKKISSKIESTRQSVPKSFVKSVEDSMQQNVWESKVITPEDEFSELERYVEKQNKVKTNKVYDILDIDNTCKTHLSKEQILAQLQGKNIKNKTHIDNFLLKYEKKQRRVLRRQRSEKQSKSSVKSSKINSKNEDWNIFSIKLQNSHHQYISHFKSNNQNLRKYEQFQLPLILSRNNNRRTTVEK